MATQVSGAEPWLFLNDTLLSFRRTDENLDARALENAASKFRVTQYAPPDLTIRIDGAPLETEVYGRWLWVPRGYAGLYRIQVQAPGYKARTALVRVLPGKLSHERYVQMLADIQQVAEDLAYRIQSPAAEKMTATQFRGRSSALKDYGLVRSLVADLQKVMAGIKRSPQRTLERAETTVHFQQMGRYGMQGEPEAGPWLSLPQATADRIGLQVLPVYWRVGENRLTYDVYENRLLKRFLRQLTPRLIDIQERAGKELERRRRDRTVKQRNRWEDDETERIEALERVIADCERMGKQVVAWEGEKYLRFVSGLVQTSQPTQVLQKHPHYQQFYRLYLRFQQELRLTLNTDTFLTTLSLRNMADLYEVWAVFKMTALAVEQLVRAGYELRTASGLFKVRNDQFHLEVDRQAPVELAREGTVVRIRYEPVYEQADRVRMGLSTTRGTQLTPDLTIEVWRANRADAVIVFDAKYRLIAEGGTATYQPEDIEKMDHYFNAIRWKTDSPHVRPRQVVTSAYILYPGAVLLHESASPEVGALPFTPLPKQPREAARVVNHLLKQAGLL